MQILLKMEVVMIAIMKTVTFIRRCAKVFTLFKIIKEIFGEKLRSTDFAVVNQ